MANQAEAAELLGNLASNTPKQPVTPPQPQEPQAMNVTDNSGNTVQLGEGPADIVTK